MFIRCLIVCTALIASFACRADEAELVLNVHDIEVEVPGDLKSAAAAAGVDLGGVVRAAIERIQPRLRPGRPTIRFQIGKQVIPQVGLVGFTDPRSGDVLVTVDPDSRIGLRDTLEDWVGPSLAHELHHTKRILQGPGYGSTLRESLVSEGLADSFAKESYPEADAVWTHAITAEQEMNAWRLAAADLDGRYGGDDHARWFFGTDDLPNWTGYTIGFRIVQKYVNGHPGISTVDLAVVDAEEIVRDSGYPG
jgi:hypothetical protein